MIGVGSANSSRHLNRTAGGIVASFAVLAGLSFPVGVRAQTPQVDLADHWAYRPLGQPSLPEVKDMHWPCGDVDRFVLARLEAARLEPAPDADREVLVRRLYFDLIGLPPTPEQIDALVNDNCAEAVARLLDSLLASPHFGERWGRHWLDVVRFGESLTLRGLVLPEAWRFRDYVIESFNADRPIDQMIREHVSGDLLPAASVAERQRQCVASTFLTLGNWNLEEQDKRQLRMDVVDEQLDTIGKAFLALSIGCARCHDHKFDPVPTRDYYALAGILRNTKTLEDANVSKWLERPLPLEPEEEAVVALHEASVRALDEQIKRLTEAVAALDSQRAPDSIALDTLSGIVVDDSAARAIGEWTLSQSTRPYLGGGYLHDRNEHKGQKTLTFEAKLAVTGRYEVRLAYTPGSNRATNTPVTVFSAEGERTITVNQREAPAVDRHWVSLGTYRFELNGQCFAIVSNESTDGHVIADAVQFLCEEQASEANVATASIDSAASHASAEVQAALKAARAELATLKRRLKELRDSGPSRPMFVAVEEEKQIGDTYVHIRGSVHQKGKPVARGFVQAIAIAEPRAMPSDQSGRIELGQWLTSPSNPLTARVYVNRVWHWLFGAGIVRTTDNFGTAGESPSHPELLDYLATQFIADGWSTKRLVRRLALSRTYQLSSRGAAQSAEVDPDNRLLAHANRRRLDAECLRDALLSVSGELDLTMGGSTIKPNTVSDYDFQHDHLRRSVYCPVLRNKLPDLFEVFDFADPSVVTGVRYTSTVAPQALFLLNDPFVAQRAAQAAARLLVQPDLTREARIELTFRRALGRRPMDAERQLAHRFLGAGSAEAAAADSPAAWTELVHAIFASIDFRYVD